MMKEYNIDQLLYPIADALQMDLQLVNGVVQCEQKMDLELIDGIPIVVKMRVVDSIIDLQWGTVGIILKVAGSLYLAMINDDKRKELTFFLVDGGKAGFTNKFNKNGRLKIMSKWNGVWSRKKFYSAIAPGVKATFTRPSVSSTWKRESVGPEDALAYLKMRKQVSKRDKPRKIQTADEINKEFQNQRMQALTGKK